MANKSNLRGLRDCTQGSGLWRAAPPRDLRAPIREQLVDYLGGDELTARALGAATALQWNNLTFETRTRIRDQVLKVFDEFGAVDEKNLIVLIDRLSRQGDA